MNATVTRVVSHVAAAAIAVVIPLTQGGKGVDAYSLPTGHAIKSAGMQFVSDYVGCGSSDKTVTKAQVTEQHTAGLAIVDNCEQYANDALKGASKGKELGAIAQKASKALGFPSGTWIYYSVDFDAQPSQFPTIKKFLAAASSPDYPAHAYGSYALCEYLKDYCWQTYAWSYGKVSKWAALYQYRNSQTLAGHSVDFDEVLLPNHTGAWLATKTVIVAPKPTVAPKPALKTLKAATSVSASGTLKVGHVLTAVVHPAQWTAGTKYTYQWYYGNGTKIVGATHKKFKLTTKQRHRHVRVRVVGAKSGYKSVTRTSKVTSTVK